MKHRPPAPICKTCNLAIPQTYGESIKDWQNRIYCSKKCMGKDRLLPNGPKWGGLLKRARGIARRKATKIECELCGTQDRLQVHHKDENPFNNDSSNWEIFCFACHRKRHKIKKKQKDSTFAVRESHKLNWEIVKEIRNLRENGMTCSALSNFVAKEYNIYLTCDQIYRIISGASWKKKRVPPKGGLHYAIHLTDEMILFIRRIRKKKGYTYNRLIRLIKKKYNIAVSLSIMGKIITGKMWKHLPLDGIIQ